jgi:hypothetical protein
MSDNETTGNDDSPVFMHKRRLSPIGGFYTHDSYDSLQEYAERYSGNDAVVANLFIALTHNLCAKLMADSKVGEIETKHLDEVLQRYGGSTS